MQIGVLFTAMIHFLKNLLTYGSSLLRVAFSSCGEQGLLFVVVRCVGFSSQWLLLLQSKGFRRTGFSSCGSRALEHRLSSYGARA